MREGNRCELTPNNLAYGGLSRPTATRSATSARQGLRRPAATGRNPPLFRRSTVWHAVAGGGAAQLLFAAREVKTRRRHDGHHLDDFDWFRGRSSGKDVDARQGP